MSDVPTAADRSLSELELAALGNLWRHGPCTAYRVRMEFSESPSSHWSGSSGAIYPLLRRLENRGLVSTVPGARGARRGKLIAITAEGKGALRSWLASGVDLPVAAAVHDGVRTRLFFLDVLPAGDRAAFVASARQSCAEHLEMIERDLEAREEAGDDVGLLAARGAWHTARARLEWLREVERALATEASSD